MHDTISTVGSGHLHKKLALPKKNITLWTVTGYVLLGKVNFCANGYSQLWRLCHVIQSDMLTVYHSLAHLFSPVNFSISALHQLVIATDASMGLFIFRDMVCHYQFLDPGQALCVGLILPCRSIRLLP